MGLDDAYTGHARRDEAVKGLRKDLPVIGLSHIAEEADGLWRYGVPLVLSGHTHGGQVTLARLHELAVGIVAGHKYVHGLYGSRRHADHGGARAQGAVYVGAGIGAAVVPFRLGERGKREVAMFELGCEPGRLRRAPRRAGAHEGAQTDEMRRWRGEPKPWCVSGSDANAACWAADPSLRSVPLRMPRRDGNFLR